jgi:hypothetical protein
LEIFIFFGALFQILKLRSFFLRVQNIGEFLKNVQKSKSLVNLLFMFWRVLKKALLTKFKISPSLEVAVISI